MISALHLLWIVPVTMLAGFILCSLLSIKNRYQAEVNYFKYTMEKEKAEIFLDRWKMEYFKRNKLQDKLKAVERDMRTMIDCCDICGHNNNPNCPGIDCEHCMMECACRECQNSSNFVWKGNMKTERRSGIYDTGNGETQDGGGDRKGPPESVYSAQAGTGVRKGED